MPHTTIRQFNAEFRTHWWNYVLLFTGISIGLEVIFIPFFRLLATYLLHLGQVPIFTLTNITMLITQHPLVSLALVGELLLILIIGYWQFAF
ncbi:glycerophosphoryl diester phosphodiesterase membrane domain-containing protein, partial [Ligilactobacillus saerimneri]|uniref:glycerophosphoryl diester phosphodiesterase membrane domain-containing protein n=1 Tax=Ligilactobacillus saerimneri TaxID=228229 RepID=UPI0024B0772F